MAAPTNGNGKQPDDPPPEAKARRTDDAEDQRPPPAGAGNAGIPSFVQRLIRRENLQEKGGLLLQALGLLFSLLSAIIMASNKHGDWMDFDRYDEYRYLLGISILVFLYSLGQVIRQVHLSSTGRDVLPARISATFSFTGDQVAAYLMISALSAAIPITNNMRKGADNLFTDASSASISMAFFAFLSLAISALISGYKLSKQSYI
ncbi:CASP-like protein [Platanthera guangdongensis]|uniref:CASP-like protein n=1 Tax=Platanthera guangdongensis TaxID=2320717 RepID=A0ABR2LF63_9ASPA